MEFDGFIGNESVKQRLSNAFRTGQLSHSYLILGPEGSGKKTLAKILASAMQCTASSGIPCGGCSACRKVKSGVHPDVITVDDTEHKSVGVDVIRDAKADAFIMPNEGKRKVYVIPRGQDMTEPAQNAFLKILEEPPSYGAFILLATESDQLLPTVRSRCVELRLGPVALTDALPVMRQRYPDKSEQQLRAAFVRGGGYLGKTLQILESELLLPQVEQMIAGYAARDNYAVLQSLLQMEKWKREQLRPALAQLRLLLCDAMLLRAKRPAAFEGAKRLLENRTGSELLSAAQNLQYAMDALDANAAVGAVIGWLCVHLR